MVVGRLALRIDVRLLVAVIGAAAALMLPAASVVVLSGLEARVTDPEGLAIPLPGTDTAPVHATDVVVLGELAGVDVAAYTFGDPRVAPLEALRMPLAPSGDALRNLGLSLRDSPNALPLVPPDAILVHPNRLPAGELHAAAVPWGVEERGWIVLPMRSNDAFEVAGVQDVQASSTALVIISLPAVAIIAAVFAGQEARAFKRSAATLAALGRPRLGRRLLALRALWMMVLAALGAGAGTGLLVMLTGAGRAALVEAGVALLLPVLAGSLVAAIVAWRGVGNAMQLLRAPSSERESPGARIGILPVLARPLVTGWRPFGLLLIAALLFVADVGMPLAGASVPAALAGSNDEWVIGGQDGIVVGGATNLAPALVLGRHEPIDAIVGEVLLPTTLEGNAIVLRGADWFGWRQYHDATIVAGTAPGAGEIALGSRLAERAGLDLGDTVRVQGATGIVASLRVSGTFASDGLVGDEAFVPLPTGQVLAGLDAAQVTVVRARPATAAARDVLHSTSPSIEVDAIALNPATPLAGTLAHVHVHITNIGGGGGARPLTLRINGEAVASTQALLGPYESKTVQMPFVVPAGQFQVDVNPTLTATSGPTRTQIDAPRIAFNGTAWEIHVSPEARIEVFEESRMVAASQGAAASLRVDLPVGNYTIRANGAAKPVTVSPDSWQTGAHPVAQHVWSEPSRPVAGQPMTIYAQVQNLGGATGPGGIDLHRNTLRIHQWDVHLAPGESTILQLQFTPGTDTKTLRVGEHTLPVQGASGPAAPAAPVRRSDVQAGGAAQAAVADRVLGDATAVLGGIAFTALASTIAIVYLGSDRNLRGRGSILGTLATMQGAAWVRRRAALESAALAALATGLAILLGKLAFGWLATQPDAVVFGHALQDPFSVLVAIQLVAAFAGTAALAAYAASGPATLEAMPLGQARSRHDPLPPTTVQEVLDAQ